MAIKNIIFDLGGVLLDIDYQRTAGAFKKLGLTAFDAIYSQKKQDHFFDDFEKGKISEADFRTEVREFLPASVNDSDIDQAWNAMLIGLPADRKSWLKKYSSAYRLFLLSNTNFIHIRGFQHLVGDDFVPLFEKVYFSCEMGMRKPDTEIFQFVVEENSLDVRETLFIDDSPQHVTGAMNFGLNALLLPAQNKIEDFMQQLSDERKI